MSHVEIDCPFCNLSHSFAWEGKPWTVGTITCECGATFTFTIHCELSVSDTFTRIHESEASNG